MTDIVLEKQEQAKLDRALKGQGYNLRPLFELRRSLVARLGPEARGHCPTRGLDKRK